MSDKILRNYVSEMDKLLQQFDKEHPVPSLSQKKEIDKYQKIYRLRDDVERPEADKRFWDKF